MNDLRSRSDTDKFLAKYPLDKWDLYWFAKRALPDAMSPSTSVRTDGQHRRQVYGVSPDISGRMYLVTTVRLSSVSLAKNTSPKLPESKKCCLSKRSVCLLSGPLKEPFLLVD
jgi:hypothetical protein